MSTRRGWIAGALGALVIGETMLIRLGQTYGSTEQERTTTLPIPGGPPHTECGLIVEEIERDRALVLHSNSHLPKSWRAHATLAWSWSFVLTPLDEGRRTRFHFRSRWTTGPWYRNPHENSPRSLRSRTIVRHDASGTTGSKAT
jgi:hypothetical protein